MCYQTITDDAQSSELSLEDLRYAALSPKASPQIELLTQLRSLSSNNDNFIDTLDSQQTDVINHLSSMSKKLKGFVKEIIKAIDVDYSALMEVDISGGGIRFESNTSIEIDRIVKLELILMPQYLPISSFGKVIDCSRLSNGGGFRIAIEFTQISDTDRDAIVGHVLQTQSKLIREQAETAENDDE